MPREARPRTEPLGDERYRVSITLDGATYRKLEEVRAWMRHRIPDGDHGAILAQAISLLHAQEHKRKSAETPRPRPQRESARPPSRHVPAVESYLRPRGGPQERALGALQFTARHGTGWIEELASSIDPFPSEHLVVDLSPTMEGMEKA